MEDDIDMSKWRTAQMPKPWPGFDGREVDITVRIRKVDTSETREWAWTALIAHGEDEPSVYYWLYGNFSCDCNRAIFFDDAGPVGRSTPLMDYDCGEGGYLVELVNPVDGGVFYSEFPEHPREEAACTAN